MAEDIYLQDNQIERIAGGFSKNFMVNNINLSHNLIRTILPNDLALLQKLLVLNLSNNCLGEGIEPDDMQEYRENLVPLFPPSLIVLSLESNPCAVSHRSGGTPELVTYRKPFVMGLPNLETFDEIDVLQAEKLAHKGVLPKVARDLPGYLDELIKKAGLKAATEKLDNKLALEMKRQQGIDSQASVMQSLDDLGRMDEFNDLNDQFKPILEKVKMKQEEYEGVKNARQKKIAMMSKMVGDQYGKVIVPPSSRRTQRAKAEMIENEQKDKKEEIKLDEETEALEKKLVEDL